MLTSVSRLQANLRRWIPTLATHQYAPCDEIRMFSDEQIRFLAARGVIYLTERPDGRYSTIIAHDYQMAGRLACCRRSGEEIVGLMGAGFLQHLRAPAAQSQSEGETPGAVACGVAERIYA